MDGLKHRRIKIHTDDTFSPIVCPNCNELCGVVTPAGEGAIQYDCPYCCEKFINIYNHINEEVQHARVSFTILDRNYKAHQFRMKGCNV